MPLLARSSFPHIPNYIKHRDESKQKKRYATLRTQHAEIGALRAPFSVLVFGFGRLIAIF
jgi:S-adenosylmethionine:tRNA-ribosyltransferase-isomerase (queuine synthetase)